MTGIELSRDWEVSAEGEHCGRVSVQMVASTSGSDLTISEESGDAVGAQAHSYDLDVVISRCEQTLSPPIARDQQSSSALFEHATLAQ
jgi:hypothetical protein